LSKIRFGEEQTTGKKTGFFCVGGFDCAVRKSGACAGTGAGHGAFYPFFRGHHEAVKSGLFFKPLEFEGFNT
jgi:hypothetical protein